MWWGLDKKELQRSITLMSIIVSIKESERQQEDKGVFMNTWMVYIYMYFL